MMLHILCGIQQLAQSNLYVEVVYLIKSYYTGVYWSRILSLSIMYSCYYRYYG